MEPRTDLLRGTLDLLILRSLATEPLHGLGISRRIAQMTQGSFDVKAGSRLLRGLGEHPYVYFAHSYYVPVVNSAAATCQYAEPFTAVLEHENVFGVQFHPEKSGPLGLQIVKNFIEL